MKRLYAFVCTLLFVVCFSFSVTVVNAYVSVKGYYRSNGTYVAPHVRSNPNGLKSDNYSYTGGDVYNKTYGTRGTEWDTPTYITDPDYYEGKAIYDSNHIGETGDYTSISSPTVKATRDVPYVVKAWVESNPYSDCLQSTFLRQKEKQQCVIYKLNTTSYTWNVTTDEFDGKHYVYNPKTNVMNSCPDGYLMSIFDSASGKCTAEPKPVLVTCPIGYTCTPITN